MGFILQVFTALCAIFPVWFVAVFLAFFVLVVLFIAFKLIAFVFDLLPW